MGDDALMQRLTYAILTTGLFAAGPVAADTYDYEVDLSYSSFDSDSISFPFIGGFPDPTQGSSETSSSDDEISITGRWFYSGLSDEEGPRSRAAFVSRASSVSATYARLDGDASFVSNVFGNPIVASGEQTADTFGVDLRHVWQESGWYVLAGIAESSADVSFTDPGGNTSEASGEADAYFAGFGKYLGATTSLDLVVANAEAGGSDSTNVALDLTHIGQLNESWQYGVDVGVGFAPDDRLYDLRFSLYPNRDVAFGFGYRTTDDDDDFGGESSSMSAFASWFLNETTVIRADLSSGDGEAPGTEIDTDGFGIGITMRF